MKTYITMKVYCKTLRLLRLISAVTGKPMMALIQSMAVEEAKKQGIQSEFIYETKEN